MKIKDKRFIRTINRDSTGELIPTAELRLWDIEITESEVILTREQCLPYPTAFACTGECYPYPVLRITAHGNNNYSFYWGLNWDVLLDTHARRVQLVRAFVKKHNLKLRPHTEQEVC